MPDERPVDEADIRPAEDAASSSLRGPAKWVREESFWKDVTTRTLAGLIVAFVIWGVGVAIGVFDSEGAVEGFIRVLELIVITTGSFGFAAQLRLASRGESVFAPGQKSVRSSLALRFDALYFLIPAVLFAADFTLRSFTDTRIF
ncbi:hypothetical protein ACI3KS_12280 [Microbacterium sp. ZW T5_45]|uniref:hypothetical protein n=1 Tax=Microbacterium sp. ZW T5_45 TaxID=3378080 RepID=UPI00385365B3